MIPLPPQEEVDVVTDAFVLLPEKDPAALAALKAYRDACGSQALRQDLDRWIRDIEKRSFKLGSLGKIKAAKGGG